MGYEPSFSIIIITYNRAHYLESCLRRLELLDYSNFEVVVVNGPSTDETERVLQLFPRVRICVTEEGNVSKSRNVGLHVAEGELVAFIDDDALASRDWLKELSASFDHPAVGGVGGLVYGLNPRRVDFSYGIVDIYGRVDPVRSQAGDYNHPNGYRFNSVMGTNCGFRRLALSQIGLFDEEFDYYHDEADICRRLIGAGWKITFSPGARVVHLSATGPTRSSRFDVNWHTILKNTVYFALKHGSERKWRCLHSCRAMEVICRSRFLEFTRWFLSRKVSLQSYWKILRGAYSGLWAGYQKARSTSFISLPVPLEEGGGIRPFRPSYLGRVPCQPSRHEPAEAGSSLPHPDTRP